MLRLIILGILCLPFFSLQMFAEECTDTPDQCAFLEANTNIVGRGEVPNQTKSTQTTANLYSIPDSDLRNGNITLDDIPKMIASVVEYLMAIAASVSIAALIYHAVRMQLASGITGDSSGVDNAKKGIYGSILGFILAMSAWYLMTRLVEILSTTTQ